MRRFLTIIYCLFVTVILSAQTPLISNLQKKHNSIQKQIAATEKMLKTTRKDVRGQLHHLQALNGQIEERKRFIETINGDVKHIEGEVTTLSSHLNLMQRDLDARKKKYLASVNYVYRNKTIQEKLMFIFSAQSLSQMYRRLRYVKEYATYQRLQGEDIMRRQAIINGKRHQLVQVKQVKVGIAKEGENEKSALEKKEQQKKQVVSELQKKQRSLQNIISKKRREANNLNSRIDRLITMEIEKARKRAAEEARRKRIAEEKRLAAIAARRKAEALAAQRAAEEKERRELAAKGSNNSSSSRKSESKRAEHKKIYVAPVEEEKAEVPSISSVDRQLSNSFAGNRGHLPMPMTGNCMVISHYGQYAVEGMKNVKLDNKGIDIQGRPGANARAVFNGEVSAVFPMYGLFNILIRHGDYITVYCNLSSVSVRQGEHVSTRQIIGKVFSDASDGGRTVLHFQLRKERAKLNPEAWLRR
jgi:septal ring factor EnvC (AmiA/AmiB activator)